MPKERTVNGVTDFEAAWAAEVNYWGILAMQHADAAAFCERMGRIATLDNNGARRILIKTEAADPHDKFLEEFVEENGDFREVPFGLVSNESGKELRRVVKRRELAAERAKLSEKENLRRMLEAKSVLGTEEEKGLAFAALAELGDDDSGISLPDVEA